MFKGKLYEPQVEGAEFIANKRKALLAWEQGTGKTIISIAAKEKLTQLNKVNTAALVLSPGSLTWQFADRIREFTDSSVNLVEAAKPKTRFYDSTSGIIDYFVVSYGLFRNDYDEIVSNAWDIVIADEAEMFTNHRSKTHKQLLAFNRKIDPDYRFALSGTAISNKLEDLYAIMYWVDKRFLPLWPTFEKTHIKRSSFGAIIDYKNLRPLNKHLKNRVNRKTEKDLKGQMPKLMPPVQYMIPKDKEYIVAEEALLGALDKQVENMKFKDGELVSGYSSKVSKTFHSARMALISRAKIDAALSLSKKILQENENNRIVFFSFYKEPLERLQAELAIAGISGNAVKFTGDESSDQKRKAIDAFRTSSRILLCSNAGARGLDLPFANYVIHLDIPFSYGILDQRNKRIVRASSDFHIVRAIYLMVENSIEFYYYCQVRNKERLAKATLEGGEDEVTMKVKSLRQYINERT